MERTNMKKKLLLLAVILSLTVSLFACELVKDSDKDKPKVTVNENTVAPPEPTPDTQPENKPETKPQVAPETDPETEPETEAKTEADSKPAPNPGTNPGTEPEPPHAHAHAYTNSTVSASALKSKATCTTAAVYYKSCACGAISNNDADTFIDGEPAAHSFVLEYTSANALKSEATCTGAAVYYKSCTCGAISTNAADTFTSGSPLAHSYTVETVAENALKSGATCTGAAVYYKSCTCGAVSTNAADIFTVGEGSGHNYENVVTAAAFKETGVFYKTCSICDTVSTSDRDTFEWSGRTIKPYVKDGLVAWFDGANNSNGEHSVTADLWKDLSGNANHIDLSDAVSQNQIDWSNGALVIKEGGCYLKLPDAVKDALQGNAYTIEIVTNNLGYTATAYITLLSSSNDELSMFIRCAEGNSMKMEYKNQDANADSNRPFVYDAWNHFNGKTLAITADLDALDENGRDFNESTTDTDNVIIYSDAVRIASGESEYNMELDNVYFGHTAANRAWHGEILAIRIYDRALTAAEVAENAAADQYNYRSGQTFEPVPQYNSKADENYDGFVKLEGYTNDRVVFNKETDIIPLTGFFASTNLLDYLYPYESDKVQWEGARLMLPEEPDTDSDGNVLTETRFTVMYQDFCARAGVKPVTGREAQYVVLKMVACGELEDLTLTVVGYDAALDDYLDFTIGSAYGEVDSDLNGRVQYLIYDISEVMDDCERIDSFSFSVEGMQVDTVVFLYELAIFETAKEAYAYAEQESTESVVLPEADIPTLDGLVGYLPLDKQVGNKIDSDIVPERVDAPAFDAAYNGAGFSTGMNGYLTLGENWKPGTDSFSASMWFKGDTDSGRVCLLANQSWGPEDMGFIFVWYLDQGEVRGVFNFNGVKRDYRFKVPEDYLNRWMYITLVVDRENRRVKMSFDFNDFQVYDLDPAYDGVSFDSYNYDGNYPGDAYQSEIEFTTYRPIAIGSDGIGNYRAPNGNIIDEVLIFDKALIYDDLVQVAEYYDIEATGTGYEYPVDRMTVDKHSAFVGESINVTAWGAGTDWVGIGDMDGATYWYYVADKGMGVAFDVNSLVEGGLPAGRYFIYLIANDGDWNGAHIDEHIVTIYDPSNFADAYALKNKEGNAMGMFISDVKTEGDTSFVTMTAYNEDPMLTIVSGFGKVVPSFMAIKYRTNADVNGRFFYGSSYGPNGTDDTFAYTWENDEEWHVAVIDLANTGATNMIGGVLNYLRMDFIDGIYAEDIYFDMANLGFFETAEKAASAFN